MLALRRENKEVLWGSMIKDTIKRKKPSFNETYHGYRTFSELLEDAQAILDRPDRMTHRRGTHSELAGGRREATPPGDSQKNRQVREQITPHS